MAKIISRLRRTKEGLKRLILGADITFTRFGVFQKINMRHENVSGRRNIRIFRKWEKINDRLWSIYWKLCKPKIKRKRVICGKWI